FIFSACFTVFVVIGCGITRKTIERKPTAATRIDSTEITADKPIKKAEFPPPFRRSDVPETPREFRAAWIATVDNIDWPSRPGLPVTRQKAELKAIMNRAASLHLNAVIFQIRPSADAFYDSRFEPWSYYLTGKQGRAPQPYYDPLK